MFGRKAKEIQELKLDLMSAELEVEKMAEVIDELVELAEELLERGRFGKGDTPRFKQRLEDIMLDE
jgi:hypothetical protein